MSLDSATAAPKDGRHQIKHPGLRSRGDDFTGKSRRIPNAIAPGISVTGGDYE